MERPVVTTASVILCADDYAMNGGVSRGILELAGRRRISATSAMTNAADWPLRARELVGPISVGLHLTLTWGRPLGPMPSLAPGGDLPPLRRVLERALLGRLPIDELEGEFDRQLCAFADATGRPPDFVDGHQHVHVLPGVRRAIFRVLSRHELAGRTWIRDSSDRVRAIATRRYAFRKAMGLRALATGFAAQASGAGFRTNAGFAGYRSFDPHEDLDRAFRSFFVARGRRHLVMCHPGHVDDGGGLDEIVEARSQELAYLKSPRFAELLAECGVALGRNLSD